MDAAGATISFHEFAHRFEVALQIRGEGGIAAQVDDGGDAGTQVRGSREHIHTQ